MDLIATLTQKLGVSPDKAEGLAGGALGMIKDQVAQHVGADQAQQLASKIPELSQWADKANTLRQGSAGGAGLLGALDGLVGGGDQLGALGTLISGAGLNLSAAQALLPPIVEFLKTRLDPEMVQKIGNAVPLLRGLTGGGVNLSGTLGGLFGTK